jgi:hypothetical protein
MIYNGPRTRVSAPSTYQHAYQQLPLTKTSSSNFSLETMIFNTAKKKLGLTHKNKLT